MTQLTRSNGTREEPLVEILSKIEGCLLLPQSFVEDRIVYDMGGDQYLVPMDDPIRMIEEYGI